MNYDNVYLYDKMYSYDNMYLYDKMYLYVMIKCTATEVQMQVFRS